MPDYKEMYFHMVRETEKAIRILIKAQRDCEEMYLGGPEEKPAALGLPNAVEEAGDA